MQILAAYLFELNNITSEEIIETKASIQETLKSWLAEKGASNPLLDEGDFITKTRGAIAGTFQWKTLTSVVGEYRELSLQEPTSSGQVFLTTIHVVSSANKIVVYVTLGVRNADSMVAPVFTDPRCPLVVKRLLNLRSDWSFSGNPVPRPVSQHLKGNDGGMSLSGLIQDQTRSLPVIVVAEVDGEPVWNQLEEKLAADLAGLAHVFRIDEEASWCLTDEVGKVNSCYLGAVRLYWPIRQRIDEDSIPLSSVWTASNMLSQDSDGKGIHRLTASVRRNVMNVSALTIDPPPLIREIQNQASRVRLKELEERANSNSEELELARLFIEENEQLKGQLDDAMREVARQSSRAEAAEYALNQVRADDKSDPLEKKDLSESDAPESGEIRFYKKTHSTPSYDVLVQISDCGHNSWQSATKAEKARNGVKRLEGIDTWENIYHCARCTGGGVWKVIWK